MLSLALTGLQRRRRAFYSRLIALAETNYKQQTIIASTSNSNESIIMRQVKKKKEREKKWTVLTSYAHLLLSRPSIPNSKVFPSRLLALHLFIFRSLPSIFSFFVFLSHTYSQPLLSPHVSLLLLALSHLSFPQIRHI